MSTQCSSCGANNPDGAAWCNQCFAALSPGGVASSPAAPEPALAAPPAPTTTAESVDPVTEPAGDGVAEDSSGADEHLWTCTRCDTPNPLSSNICSVCQAPIFVSFGAEQTPEPTLSPTEAAVNAVVPGLAHIRLGQTMMGVTIALLAVILLGFALLILVSAGRVLGPILGVLATVVLVLISAYDAQQIANRRPGAVLLKPRVLTFYAAGAIGLVVVVVWIQGLAGAATAP